MFVRARSAKDCRRVLPATIAAFATLAFAAAPSATAGTMNGTQFDPVFQDLLAAPGELNKVLVAQTPASITITDTNPMSIDPLSDLGLSGAGCVAAGVITTCSLNGLLSVTISLGEGNDTATIDENVTIPVVMSGEFGDDTLNGTSNDNSLDGGDGNDTLNAGDGNDSVIGFEGNDTLTAGDGDDILDGGNGVDVYAGGPGTDLAIVTSSTAGIHRDVVVSLDDVANDGGAGEGENIGADIENVQTMAGKDTITGNAEVNMLTGGAGDDTIDGGTGSDVLSGNRGNDVLQSRDGYADRVDCGTGADTAVVDTLDLVGISCETVDKADVGSALDDKSPTISFANLKPGRSINGNTVLRFKTTDDHGIAQIKLLDDGRAAGTSTAAPWEITYKPTTADLGQNTLVAIVTDTNGQSAVAVISAKVKKVSARSVSATVSKRGKGKYRVSGSVKAPKGVGNRKTCRGAKVSVQAKRGARTVATRTARLSGSCKYSANVAGSGPLTLVARYLGNKHVAPTISPARAVGG